MEHLFLYAVCFYCVNILYCIEFVFMTDDLMRLHNNCQFRSGNRSDSSSKLSSLGERYHSSWWWCDGLGMSLTGCYESHLTEVTRWAKYMAMMIRPN